jgi:GT2 family glycosyltransferase
VLKVTEQARAVLHVPRVLYHWRTLESSTAGSGEAAKPWAFEAGKRAIQAHCERIGMPARCERDPDDPGVYHLQPELVDEPLVSIVIPTAGQVREIRYQPVVLVSHCLRSIVETSSYKNYELVVVVDSPADPALLEELRQIGDQRLVDQLEAIAGDRLRLVRFDGPFSFSRKINQGAIASQGEHLLLLNDDIEVATPDWIERMVMYSGMEEIGAVGGRLVLEDGRLQHVGVRFQGGLPGHPYLGFRSDFRGYANGVRVAGNCLAVTAACLMTRRQLFEQLGGLDRAFPVNYNDVDYCLKLLHSGYRNVFDPYAELFHFETSSRATGSVSDQELQTLRDRWGRVLRRDPYYNPGFGGRPDFVVPLSVPALAG